MFHYKAFGLEISSEIELLGMIGDCGNRDVRIILGKVDSTIVSGTEVGGPNICLGG